MSASRTFAPSAAPARRAILACSLLAAALAALCNALPADAINLNGGSSAIAIAQPVVASLTLPSTAAPGRPPRVTFRIEEPGITRVDLTIAVHDLSTRKAALVAQMGWVRTGRTIAVVWPHGATLAAGSYHLSLSAHDRYGHSLKRTAHSSGVATLSVAPPATPAPAAALPAPSAEAPLTASLEAGVPTPAQTLADGAVFPVQGAHNFGGPENRFGAPRDGYLHQGQDILTAEGTPIVAPLAGTIASTGYQASGAGYYAVEDTTIGLDFFFAHCKQASLVVSAAQSVSAGAPICQAGQTGDATAPHLDFEIWLDGWRESSASHAIDPLAYLQAWEQGS